MASSQGTLCLFIRDIIYETDLDINSTQLQIFYKTDTDKFFIETSSSSFLYFNANLDRFDITFQLCATINNEQRTYNKYFKVNKLNLAYFEPKSFYVIFTDKEIADHAFYLVIDCFYFSAKQEEKAISEKSFYLLDLEIENANNLQETIETLENQLNKKKKIVGYFLREYILEFQYINQLFTLKLNKDQDGIVRILSRTNTFLVSKNYLAPLIIKFQYIEYEWFTEHQERTAKEIKVISSLEYDLLEFLSNTYTEKNINIYEKLELSCSFTLRDSTFMNNFISYLNLRVLETNFYGHSITNPVIKVHLLGTNQEWEIEPYNAVKMPHKIKHIWDYHYNYLHKEGKIKDIDNIYTENMQDHEYLKKQSENFTLENELKEIKNLDIHPKVEELLKLYYDIEEYEINNKEPEFSIINRKNTMFFYLCVPNEIFYIEVYELKNQQRILTGYAFLSVANLEFDQSIYIPIHQIGNNNASNKDKIDIGMMQIRANLYPISFMIDNKMVANMKSLDFDDISQFFSNLSNLKEVVTAMDKNIKDCRNQFWKNGIRNIFLNLQENKKLIMNLMDFQNIREIYHPDIDFSQFKIKVKLNQQVQQLLFKFETLSMELMKRNHPKEYYMFTNDYLNQAVLESEKEISIVFKINDKEYGILTALQFPDTDHFQFKICTPLDSCSISLYYKDEVLNYHSFDLNHLPIGSDDHAFFVDLKIDMGKYIKNMPQVEQQQGQNKGEKIKFMKKSIYLFFTTHVDNQESNQNEEEDEEEAQAVSNEPEYSKGIYDVSLVSIKNGIIIGNVKSNSAYKYEVEIIHNDGSSRKKIDLKEEIYIERTRLSNICTFQKRETDQIEININKLMGEDENVKRTLLYKKKYTLKPINSIKWNDNKMSNIEGKIKSGYNEELLFKKGSNYILTTNIADPANGKNFEFNLRFIIAYNANKFVDNPTGNLTVKLNYDIINYFKSTNYLNSLITKLKFYIVGLKEKESITLYLDNIELEKNTISTNNSTNQIIMESITDDNKIISRTLVNLYEIDINQNEEDLIIYITHQETNIPIFLYYAPIFDSDRLQQGQGELSSMNQNKAPKNAGGKMSKQKESRALIEDLRKRIHDVQLENLKLTTKLSKSKEIYDRKKKVIDKIHEAAVTSAKVIPQANIPKKNKTTLGLGFFTDNNTKQGSALNKAKELFNTICACGAGNPKFKGYCGDCLKRLREEYESSLNSYMPLAEQYDQLLIRKSTLSKKILTVKKKIDMYQKKTKELNFDFLQNKEEEAVKDEIKRLKTIIVEKNNEIEMIKQEQTFEIEAYKQKQRFLELIFKKKIRNLEEIIQKSVNLEEDIKK